MGIESLLRLTWDDVYRSCEKIAEQINGRQFDLIVPVVRGGLPASVVLSELTGIRSIRPVRFQTRDNIVTKSKEWDELVHINYNILVLDDIVDSGKTFDLMLQGVSSRAVASITFASIVVNDAATPQRFNPRDVIRGITLTKDVTPNLWVVFPWDKEYTKS